MTPRLLDGSAPATRLGARFAPLAVMLALPVLAFAQGLGVNPCALAGKGSFTASEQAEIRTFARESAEQLASSDISVSQRAREQLLAPLRCAEVTVAFRLEFSTGLEAALRPLATGPDHRVAVNALRVLGELRSAGSIRVLSEALDDQREAVRAGAAAGFRALLSSQDAGFAERDTDRAIEALRARLEKETSPRVADGLIVAMASTQTSADARRRALRVLAASASGVTARVRAQGLSSEKIEWVRAVTRTVIIVRQAMIDDVGRTLGAEFARSSAVLAGQTMALGRDLLADASARSDAALMRQTGEAVGIAGVLAVLSHDAAGQPRASDQNLRGLFERGLTSGDPSAFVQAIDEWIGPRGRLTQAPYNIRAAEFAPRR